MAKAVLVMDMPECCVDCCCGYFERYAKELNLVCGATGEDANNVEKPDWCPLRELPEKMEVLPSEKYEFRSLGRAFVAGFNVCLEKILGKE